MDLQAPPEAPTTAKPRTVRAYFLIRTALGTYYASAGRDGEYDATRADSLFEGAYSPLSNTDFRAIPHIVESLSPSRVIRVRSV